ncbi:pyocin knob domain-containing protein [Pseudobutyrivibrio sp.]|uniref:pyocin knob domain-containing protein n=1 Tax=Pseudobutyrivibrio sp. TaxID=2014367 RepID=UPI00386819F8
MGLYKNNNGVLIPIAGRGKAEYGASTTRKNTWTNTEAISVGSSVAFSVAFDTPMPDNNYEVDWTCSASALHPVIEEKTASGFTGHAYRLISPAVEIGNGIINFTAFRLYMDLEYNEVLEDTSALMTNTSEMGAVNLFETTLTSQRYNKVVYTVNDDGTVGIEILERPSGSTGNVIGWIDVKAGETYKLTGGISETERLELRNADYSSWTNNTVGKAVSSPIVETNVDTFMPNDDATLMVYCRIDESGNTGNVGTLEPMIRFASFSDDTFLPYAKTNRLLTVETDELFANAAMLKGMTAITAQTDLNDVTTIGNYYKSSTSIYVTNAPTGIDSETSAIFRLNVENGSDSTDKYIQTIIKNDGTTYKRGYDGTTWSSWIEFASSATVSGINTRLTTAETDIDNLESSRLKTYASDATAWDTSPTSASTKPVTSGGVYTGLSGKAPTNHASSATTYGVGNASNYGHVKLNDSYTTSGGAASASVGASSKAVVDGYNALNGNKANQELIAIRQANTTARKTYYAGDQFVYNNELYVVTASSIAKDTTINIPGAATKTSDITTQISKLPKEFAPIIQPLFPYTAPNDGFCTMRFAIGAQGPYHLYITVNGTLFHPFCGYGGGTGWQDSRTFAFRKGDVLAINDSSNTGNITADVILFK